MMVLALTLVIGVLFWYEWVQMDHRGAERGEKIAFVVFMLAAFGLGLASIFDRALPNPTKAIQSILDPFRLPR